MYCLHNLLEKRKECNDKQQAGQPHTARLRPYTNLLTRKNNTSTIYLVFRFIFSVISSNLQLVKYLIEQKSVHLYNLTISVKPTKIDALMLTVQELKLYQKLRLAFNMTQ